MSTAFCRNCGFPIGAGSAFCPKCGTQMQATVAPPPAPIKGGGGGSGLKILGIVLVVLMLFAVVAIGGIWYAAHRVKQAVVATAKEYGVDLPTPTSSPSTSQAHRKMCDFLSKDEASQLLGEPIERSVVSDSACLYFGPPGLSAKLTHDRTEEGSNKVQSGKVSDPGQVEQLINSVTSGMMTVDGEAPLMMVQVDYDGVSQFTALQATKALFARIPGASTEVPNLGDRAFKMIPMGLNVLKGSTVIHVVPGPIPDPDAKTIAVARKILTRL